jgi:hypothetical protein
METRGVLWDQAIGHPPEEVLERYSLMKVSVAKGTRSSRAAGDDFAETEEYERLEEHLLLCESCRKQLDECDNWVALMKAAAGPPSLGTRLRWWWENAAASFTTLGRIPVLAAGFALLFAVLWTGNGLLTEAGPPESVQLSALRGNDLRVRVRAGKSVSLQFEDLLSDDRAISVLLVNTDGKQIWSGSLAGTQAQVPGLPRGTYWVRLVSAGAGEQIREYGLVAE